MGGRTVRTGGLGLAVVLAVLALVPARALLARDPEIAAIHRALGYLKHRQVDALLDVRMGEQRVLDYPGNWPQFFRLEGTLVPRVRDVSPFVVAFVHHALTHVVEQNRDPLELSARDLRAARAMRQRAVSFLMLFASRSTDPDAGTFAFWPYDAYPGVPGPFVERLMLAWAGGPVLGGQRVPLNLHIFPDAMAIPSDADVTATTYASLLDDEALDGGPGTAVAFERFFADWRDLGLVPRRLNPPWLPPESGAFLTWLSYRAPGETVYPNDIDLVVNANVLYALGRRDRLDTPGVADAVDLINEAVALGLHRDRFPEIAEYYPDNLVFQYAVSRAFREGGVVGLAPSVQILADELEDSAIERADGTAYWDRGAPQLNTAFALLTLLNAGRDGPLLGRAAAYLTSEQRLSGGYDAATFFVARTDHGQVFEFFSPAFTTAMVLEALARHALAP